jgi:3-dehydroquinate dehydratase type I
MMLFVTIHEETFAAALDAIRRLPPDHDGIELRAEHLSSVDLDVLRGATSKPIVLTYRGGRVPDVRLALDAGIDFVDVEWGEGVQIDVPARTIVSHHDYEGMRDVETIVAAMMARGCAHTKLAATPRSFADNERLLAILAGHRDANLTVIGMGTTGLYSRILAPFRGSALTFVAAGTIAAPGQLTLERALAVYGSDRETLAADRVFAVVGNPAAHSLSPAIHNPLFRSKRVSAAYTVAEVDRFDEIVGAFRRGEPCGLSVTAPFKEDAFAFASRGGFELDAHAARARAVNTMVNAGGRLLAANTDVDGFEMLLRRLDAGPSKVAVVGAGATARAALVALENLGLSATTFNRTVSRADEPLDRLEAFGADLIINTLPADAAVHIPRCAAYIEAGYGGARREVDAARRFDGLALLEAQAVRQHELFMKVFHES